MTAASKTRRKVRLARRGVDHGTFSIAVERASHEPGELAVAWAVDEPIVLRGVAAAGVLAHRRDIVRALELFDAVRGGQSFERIVARRLRRHGEFRAAGVTIDLGDTRELEKVFVDALRGARTAARDLYAKLSWIAFDERDASLRVRFSFGAEALLDWQKETRRAAWSDRFAQALFPECAVVTQCAELTDRIARLAGRRVRLSERIVYSNAPGGGATFHHDDEPRQLGVVYTQLAGETAWFALPKRRLAGHVAAAVRSEELKRRAGTQRKALRALDEASDPLLGKLLNATPSFTRRLVADGRLHVLRPGDSILLPSHGPDDVCWHSVFALGRTPSLAHSYGIFPLRAPLSAARSRGTLRSSARSRDAR